MSVKEKIIQQYSNGDSVELIAAKLQIQVLQVQAKMHEQAFIAISDALDKAGLQTSEAYKICTIYIKK
jgi:hypothetical protein